MVCRGTVSTLKADLRWLLNEFRAFRKGLDGAVIALVVSVGKVGECIAELSIAVAGGVSSSLWFCAGWLVVSKGESWPA